MRTRPAGLGGRAHPRVGGENRGNTGKARASTGSSPRGRGKPDEWEAFVELGRLIPAWAGKTLIVAPVRTESGAHPRVGGEN